MKAHFLSISAETAWRSSCDPAILPSLGALSVIRGAAAVGVLLATAVCGGRLPTAPSPSAVVTFRVVDETFRVQLTTGDQIAAARRAQAGGPARIPNGRIVAGADVNRGWTWHLEDMAFAEATIELCDGRPSDVERQGVAFGGGRYCPWSAVIVSID
jgi:hypothetical protein